MNLIKTITIRGKLIILIVFMIICIISVGIIGYYYNNKSQVAIASLYNDNLLPIQLLNDTRTQTRANQANLLGLMMPIDSSEQKQILDNIETRNKAIDDDLMNYEKSSLDAYETESYTVLKKNLDLWRDTLSKCTDLIKSGKQNEAYALFKSVGSKALEDFQTNNISLSSYNTKLAQEVDNQNDQNSKKVRTLLITVISIALTVSIALGLLIALSIIKPILKVTDLLNKTSDFDLVYDASFDYLLKNKDETGIMANALSNMRESLKKMVEKITSISNTLEAHSEELTASTEDNTKSIGQVVATINEMAEGNSNQAEMVTKTSETISDVVKTINDVNITTEANAKNATKSLEMVDEGQKAIDIATGKMNENVVITQEVGRAVNELSEMMDKVGGIVDVITSIAGQTNLLALNAAIEAARAGEAGKGFSVVSEEIRKLAEGSSSAAKEISQIIKETIEKSKYAADSMSRARLIVYSQKEAVTVTEEAFNKIKLSVKDIVKCTQQSAVMLRNIDAVSKDIADQTQDMAAVAQQSAAGTEEVAASGEEQLASIELIAHAALELSGMAEELNNEIRKFKI
jgi:methyl-accepting chemotaxis protein